MRDEHKLVKGIHHVTSCVGGAQEDIDFLTQVVGQRMIKQTVLFDGQVPIYHLYYANADAEIGTVMTTFPYRQDGRKGRKGTGQVAVTAYSVAEDSLDFWAQHLERHGVKNSGVKRLFGRDRIYFEDPVGLGYEVVGDNRLDHQRNFRGQFGQGFQQCRDDGSRNPIHGSLFGRCVGL